MRTTVGDRPGILVTGHDLGDLEQLLDQSRDTGIDVYTHGEMLPAHAYPAFKRLPPPLRQLRLLLVEPGATSSRRFNGPVLVTTNCIVPPQESYLGRIYTTGPAGCPGVPHIPGCRATAPRTSRP